MDKQLEKIVKELLELRTVVADLQAKNEVLHEDVKQHVDMYNEHVKKLHMGL